MVRRNLFYLVFVATKSVHFRIAFLTMGWGAMTMIFGTVSNFSGVIAVRFFLGAFEAGLFPGLVYWITFWYKQDERALRISLVEAVATLGE